MIRIKFLAAILWCVRPAGTLHPLNAFADSVLSDHFLPLDAAKGSRTETNFSRIII